MSESFTDGGSVKSRQQESSAGSDEESMAEHPVYVLKYSVFISTLLTLTLTCQQFFQHWHGQTNCDGTTKIQISTAVSLACLGCVCVCVRECALCVWVRECAYACTFMRGPMRAYWYVYCSRLSCVLGHMMMMSKQARRKLRLQRTTSQAFQNQVKVNLINQAYTTHVFFSMFDTC